MEENLDRMLAKLDLILGLARDCNSTLKRIQSQGESGHINSVPSDDVRNSRVVENIYIFSTITRVTEDPLVNFDTQIIDEIHEFFLRVPITMYMCELSLAHLYLLMFMLMIITLIILSVSQYLSLQ